MPFTFNFGNFGGFNPGGYQTGGQGAQPDFTQRPQKERKPRKPIGTPFTRTLINLAVTVLVGLVSGYQPANKAVKISALEAIRNE